MTLVNPFKDLQVRIPKKQSPNIHSELHALVDETRKIFGETAKKGVGSFGYYLGYFKRMGVQRVRSILSETKDAVEPRRAFWWRVGQDRKNRQ